MALVGTTNEDANSILHHIALEFKEQNNHFVIIPCKKPKEIIQHYKNCRHQMFVFENVCGQDQHQQFEKDAANLKKWDKNFKLFLNEGKTKIMISCNRYVLGNYFDQATCNLFFSECIQWLH